MARTPSSPKSRKASAPRPARTATGSEPVNSSHLAPPSPDSAGQTLAALRTIQQVAQSFSSELELEPLLRKVLRAAMEVANAGAGSLLLHDAATDELRFEVIEGSGQSMLEGRRMSSRQGIAGWAFTHGELLLVPDVSQDARFYKDFDQSSGFQTTSLVALPLIIAGKKIGVLEVLNKRTGEHFSESDVDVLTVLAAQSAIAIENARLYHHLWAERNRILAVEEDVRRELARDVHDGPTQLLSALVMNVRFVQELLAEDSLDLAKQELLSVEELATRALRQMRELLFIQRPLVLETQGLIPAIVTYVTRLNEAHELRIKLDMATGPLKLPGKGDHTVFSIIVEAVRNVKKHASGAQVQMRVSVEDQTLLIVISDNGPGFDLASVRAGYDQRGSLGLLNMTERAQQINGSLVIESGSGKGTTVSLRVPLNAEVPTASTLLS